MRFGGIILAAVKLVACSNAAPTAVVEKPLPAGIEEVRATIAFGDPPLRGDLGIKAATNSTDWVYSIDLDEDGRAEEMGPLHLGIRVAYRFEDPGPHRIRIDLEREGEHHRLDRFVVVNDTTATALVAEFSSPESPFSTLSAPLLDQSATRLLVVDDERDRLHAFAIPSLTPLLELSLPQTELMVSSDLAVSGDTLFIGTGDSVIAVRVAASLGFTRFVADGHWGPRLAIRSDGLLYVGGFGGIALVDPRTGDTRVAREYEDFGGGDFALSPDERTIAQIKLFPEPSLSLLSASDLSEQRRINFEVRSEYPVSLIFHPHGDRIYLLLQGFAWRLLVLDSTSLGLLSDMTLAPAGGFDAGGFATLSADGRFVVFPASIGAFFHRHQDGSTPVSDHGRLARPANRLLLCRFLPP